MFKKRIVAMILAIALLATGVWALADGEWTVRTSVKGISNDKQAKHALKNALKEYVGYDIKPLGLLGTQVVAGTNYCILCYGSTVTAKPAHALCKVYVYEALDGKAEITKIEEIKLKNAPSGGWKLSNSKGKLKVGKVWHPRSSRRPPSWLGQRTNRYSCSEEPGTIRMVTACFAAARRATRVAPPACASSFCARQRASMPFAGLTT